MYLPRLILKIAIFCLLAFVVMPSPSFAGTDDGYVVKRMQRQANTAIDQLMEQRDKEIEAHTNIAQDKIQSINESTEMEIANVPQFFYNGWGYPVANPDYERTVAYMRVDAQKKINAINKDLKAMLSRINGAYQEKLNAIDSSVANVSSQIRPGTSDIQMSPVGANLYVRNYVNYVADQPKPPAKKGLHAREKSLACKSSRQSAEKDIKP